MLALVVAAAVGAVCPVTTVPALGSSRCVRQSNLKPVRYACALAEFNGTTLAADTTYVVIGRVSGNFTLSRGTVVVGGRGGGHVAGSLSVRGNDAGVCNLGLDVRVAVSGASATGFTAVNVTVVHDDVGIMIVGAAPRQNQIDVTNLSVSGVVAGGRNIVVAAAHAFSQTPAVVECPPGGTLLLQPFVSEANVTGTSACAVVDLYTLLAVFGQPYEVRPLPESLATTLHYRLRLGSQ